MDFYVVDEINQFVFLAYGRWLTGYYSIVDYFFLKSVIVVLKSCFGCFEGFCPWFNLDVFYLELFACFAVGITFEHTCSEAEKIKNGHQQIR